MCACCPIRSKPISRRLANGDWATTPHKAGRAGGLEHQRSTERDPELVHADAGSIAAAHPGNPAVQVVGFERPERAVTVVSPSVRRWPSVATMSRVGFDQDPAVFATGSQSAADMMTRAPKRSCSNRAPPT